MKGYDLNFSTLRGISNLDWGNGSQKDFRRLLSVLGFLGQVHGREISKHPGGTLGSKRSGDVHRSPHFLPRGFFASRSAGNGDFYNRERAYQGLENSIINPFEEEQERGGLIDCRSRLGGLMNYYYRKAA